MAREQRGDGDGRRRQNMLDYDPDLWDRVMSVNVKGTGW